jgi:hypothetical protein
MVSQGPDQRRREESATLVNYLTKSYGWGWSPVLDADGRPVPHAGAATEITPELVAACGFEIDALGRGVVIPRRVAEDVATLLRGLAVLNSEAAR